ncbi:MAG TPA: AI-2E family transporter [Burkholderiales bacterium]|nr:AI-2E family transporter [Burkholderiales bacterium]
MDDSGGPRTFAVNATSRQLSIRKAMAADAGLLMSRACSQPNNQRPREGQQRGDMFGWDSRAAKAAWTVGLVALAFYVAYAIRKTLLIFLLALFFAYMIAPLVGFIDRHMWRRIPRVVSVLLAVALVVVVLGSGAALVAPSISEEAQKLAEQLPKLTEESAIVDRIPLPGWLEQYRERMRAFVHEGIRSAETSAVPFAKDVGAGILGFAGNLIFLVLIPILAIIFVKDGPGIRKALVRVAPPESRGRFSNILSELHDALGAYVRALGLLCIATLVAYGLVFNLSGVPYASLLAAIAGLLEIIPLVGPLAAALVALFVAGVSGYEHLFWIAAFIAGYRVFQDYVLAPYVMSGGIGIHPALVILGLLAGEQLGGVAGMFLSIPTIAALIILEKHIVVKPARAAHADRSATHQRRKRPPDSHTDT